MDSSLSLIPLNTLFLESQGSFGNFWKKIKILSAAVFLSYVLTSCSLAARSIPTDCEQIDPKNVITEADPSYIANNAHDNSLEHEFYVLELTSTDLVQNRQLTAININEKGTKIDITPSYTINDAYICHYYGSASWLAERLKP